MPLDSIKKDLVVGSSTIALAAQAVIAGLDDAPTYGEIMEAACPPSTVFAGTRRYVGLTNKGARAIGGFSDAEKHCLVAVSELIVGLIAVSGITVDGHTPTSANFSDASIVYNSRRYEAYVRTSLLAYALWGSPGAPWEPERGRRILSRLGLTSQRSGIPRNFVYSSHQANVATDFAVGESFTFVKLAGILRHMVVYDGIGANGRFQNIRPLVANGRIDPSAIEQHPLLKKDASELMRIVPMGVAILRSSDRSTERSYEHAPMPERHQKQAPKEEGTSDMTITTDGPAAGRFQLGLTANRQEDTETHNFYLRFPFLQFSDQEAALVARQLFDHETPDILNQERAERARDGDETAFRFSLTWSVSNGRRFLHLRPNPNGYAVRGLKQLTVTGQRLATFGVQLNIEPGMNQRLGDCPCRLINRELLIEVTGVPQLVFGSGALNESSSLELLPKTTRTFSPREGAGAGLGKPHQVTDAVGPDVAPGLFDPAPAPQAAPAGQPEEPAERTTVAIGNVSVFQVDEYIYVTKTDPSGKIVEAARLNTETITAAPTPLVGHELYLFSKLMSLTRMTSESA